MKLQELLEMNESPKLDFKQIWKKEDYKGELIKDIISIANGNPMTVGKEGFLVFGVSDDKKKLYSITDDMLFINDKNITNISSLERNLLINLNTFVQPNFLHLKLEFLISENNERILLIRIPSHPYLLSLSRNLETKITYKKGTVFFRVGEDINIASPEVIRAFDKQYKIESNSKNIINNNDNTKIAMQNSINNGTQTFNF